VAGEFAERYNTVRLHSALGYVTRKDRLEGWPTEIYATRDRKLEAAREKRRQRRDETEAAL
jgi:putative transposase